MLDIGLQDYNYDLPAERIAQHPASVRDMSKILIYKDAKISEDLFRNIADYLAPDSFLVFNNTRVIKARFIFRKKTGALIEILCLEPLSPVEYELSFSTRGSVDWKCLIGNLKKWNRGKIMAPFEFQGNRYELTAEIIQPDGDVWRIRFNWNNHLISFGEVIESMGHIPLPPYIDRKDEAEDALRYQTIYSQVKGSVAAPTAGLHFTDDVFIKLVNKGIKSSFITLHVGAGTFKPVSSDNISDHEMHSEHFFVTAETIRLLLDNKDRIIPVGTTSVRTLESIYWLGVKLIHDPSKGPQKLFLGQWEAYNMENDIPLHYSLEAILNFMEKYNLSVLQASTSIIIVPGYKFRITGGMITNFHQPRSTLLLLISAWTGIKWKEIYTFAIEKGFRFLSYGDSSLLLK